MNKPKRKSNHIVGLDLGTYSLKLVESISQDTGYEIQNAVSVSIPEKVDKSNPESLGKWISDVWKSENIRTRLVRLALPRHQVLLTELEIPPGDDAETKQMLELQLERALPVPIDSVKSDYIVIANAELGDRKVVVLSVKTEIIDFYKSVIRQAGLLLESIELSSLSLNRSILSVSPTTDFWMAVQVGYTTTELIISDGAKMIFSRSASLGTKTKEESDKVTPGLDSNLVSGQTASGPCWIDRLVFEVKRSMEAFTQEFGKSAPKRLLLSGGGIKEDNLLKTMQRKLGDDVQIFDLSSQLANRLKLSPDKAYDFTIAYGLIVPGQLTPQYCDLLHPRLFAAEPSRLPAKMRQILVGVVCAVVIVGILMGALYQRERTLASLQKEYSKYSSLVAQSEQLSASASLVRTWKKEQTSVLDLLHELSALWTDDAYLQVISYDRTKDITVTGLATSNQAVSEILVKINQSPVFVDTKFTYIRSSRRNPTYPVEFGLSMKYKPRTGSGISTVSGRSN